MSSFDVSHFKSLKIDYFFNKRIFLWLTSRKLLSRIHTTNQSLQTRSEKLAISCFHTTNFLNFVVNKLPQLHLSVVSSRGRKTEDPVKRINQKSWQEWKQVLFVANSLPTCLSTIDITFTHDNFSLATQVCQLKFVVRRHLYTAAHNITVFVECLSLQFTP